MEGDNDPRFEPLAGGSPSATGCSSSTTPPVRWTIRTISKHFPEGRTFFHDYYRPFRLKMLKDAPYAYGSTFERVSLHTTEQWDARWSSPNAIHFVALLSCRIPADNTDPKIISALTLRGPGCDSCWEINAVFTDEEYRRMGIAKSVMDEVVKYVERERGNKKTLMRLGVLAENEEAEGLYEKVGFLEKWADGGGLEMVRILG
ncbi:hypothetical protein B0T14DRAFT_563841 [Immersiella caudata]|uniref:N-acetyltransferase domain-containing protein n=1 Tax=Immersiella caudata TaxID=314043 RepID=A0AA40C2F2_9PEZI|nr:hypothetical protein B0T14DRAFT_563841 [Immersiella caudata]